MQGVFFACFFRSEDADEALPSPPRNTSQARKNICVFLREIRYVIQQY